MRFCVERALVKAALECEVVRLKAERQDSDDGLIGASPAMARLKEMIRRIGAAELPVMVLGPTGSGKELVAKALYKASARRGSPLVSIHCGAIPAELIESELFGHLKGHLRRRPGPLVRDWRRRRAPVGLAFRSNPRGALRRRGNVEGSANPTSA